MNCMNSLIVNHKRMENCIINGDFEIPFFNTETETQEMKGLHGSVITSRNTDEIRFTVPMTYNNADGKTKNEIMEDITGYVDYDEPVRIRIEGEEWYWWGIIDGPLNIKFFKHIYYEFDLKVTLIDPYRYSADTFKNTAVSDEITVLNNGSAPTPFELTATALKSSSFFAVTDENEQHFLIGEDSEEETIKDYSPGILRTELTSPTGWSRMGASDSIPDRYLGGTTGGALTQNAESWSLNLDSIQQSSGWRGMGYKRSFSRTIQNFKTTFKFFVRNKNQGSGKIGQFYYDDNNRLIFSIGYQDVHSTKDSGTIVVMAYNEAGEEQRLWHLPLQQNIRRIDDIIIYISLERKGEELKMRTWTYNDVKDRKRNKPINVRNKTFSDKGKFYQRKIGSVALGTFRGSARFKYMNHLGTYNNELLDMPVGAADMFIKKGDLIILDTRENFITVNGEPYILKKSFSSTFFLLKSGLSGLLISPTETFDTQIRWQDRFK